MAESISSPISTVSVDGGIPPEELLCSPGRGGSRPGRENTQLSFCVAIAAGNNRMKNPTGYLYPS